MSASIPPILPNEAEPSVGDVVPIKRAEELLRTLRGVVSARIVCGSLGNVTEIHVLARGDVPAKQMVRNIESALMAQLGMRVDHRKISIATTKETRFETESPRSVGTDGAEPAGANGISRSRHPASAIANGSTRAGVGAVKGSSRHAESGSVKGSVRAECGGANGSSRHAGLGGANDSPHAEPSAVIVMFREGPDGESELPRSDPGAATTMPHPALSAPDGSYASTRIPPPVDVRRLYFEDVDVRRSRTKGVSCRVTLRRGEESFSGEAEGPDSDRARIELSARATLMAIQAAEGRDLAMRLDGCKVLAAFDREFAFVGIVTSHDREARMLTGTCEIHDSAETASALAVLDATNRVIARGR